MSYLPFAHEHITTHSTLCSIMFIDRPKQKAPIACLYYIGMYCALYIQCVYAHSTGELREPDSRYKAAMKRHEMKQYTEHMPPLMSLKPYEGCKRCGSKSSQGTVSSCSTDEMSDQSWLQVSYVSPLVVAIANWCVVIVLIGLQKQF